MSNDEKMTPKHDQNEKDELFKKAQDNASESMKNLDHFDQVILETLDSFAHRYLQSDTTNDSKAIKQEDFHYVIASVEPNMKAALKIENQDVRDELIKNIQEIGLKQNPKVLYSLEVKLSQAPETDFTCHLKSVINWNHPNYQAQNGREAISEKSFHCEDALFLRNNLAKHLEDVCAQFL